MPNGTPTSANPLQGNRPRVYSSFEPLSDSQAPHVSPHQIKPPKALGDTGVKPMPSLLASAHRAQKARRAHWATLDLRQQWADETYLRAHLKAAGVRINATSEPATVTRMKALLRRAGVRSPEVQDAVGMPLQCFLESNPRLPLWVAVAMVLEATGRFTPVEGGAA